MAITDKFWRWLGVEEELKEEKLALPESTSAPETGKANKNVVSLHSNKTLKVVVCEPESFEEVQVLADHLKSRRQVILNFENTSPEVAQRIIDFLSGTTYSLDGHSQQLGPHIFIFTPSNVEISTDHRTIIRKHGLGSSWGGNK
ncbi:cell division protein SepF [Thermosyntropha sp.]|uniref:cell division protein SepF n=1 Tax=Thermosyntropha sp. TaxID=2740820 RepID=UPI0025F2353E|nr:cell division protein SepF [Thermosyntropha sp.]MBO8158580.1 cell division protein SepF [Thermosyntropha sp.]